MQIPNIFWTASTRALDTWKFFKGFVNFFSSNSEAAQNFRDEVDIEEAKSFGWIKEHALLGPNSQILAAPEKSFPELTRGDKSVSTGVQIGMVFVSAQELSATVWT